MDNLFPLLTACFFWLAISAYAWRIHQQRKRVITPLKNDIIVAYASQTGYAENIAKQYVKSLEKQHQVTLLPLNNITIATLSEAQKVLFVVSTYGNGEAPDNATLFTKNLLTQAPLTLSLSQLQYSIVALGDNSYPDFCGFGYALEKRLQHHGAQALSNIITVNCYDPDTTPLADITPSWVNITPNHQQNLEHAQADHYWQLIERNRLNPKTPANGLYQLYLKSIGPSPIWQAGDLFDLQTENTAEQIQTWLHEQQLNGEQWVSQNNLGQKLKHWLSTRDLTSPIKSQSENINDLLQQLPTLPKRSYSIASVPEEGLIQLIVRQQQNSNELGLGSGYLTHHCQLGDIFKGQVHTVNAYHSPDNALPIVLIGAGSGLAGLRAQILARTIQSNTQNLTQNNDKSSDKSNNGNIWLIYGERHRSPELPLNKMVNDFLLENKIQQLDCAFSQPRLSQSTSDKLSSNNIKYVQNILQLSQKQIKQWHQLDASFYVCGSLNGMGEMVHQTLQTILGEETLANLQQNGKYIRDVY